MRVHITPGLLRACNAELLHHVGLELFDDCLWTLADPALVPIHAGNGFPQRGPGAQLLAAVAVALLGASSAAPVLVAHLFHHAEHFHVHERVGVCPFLEGSHDPVHPVVLLPRVPHPAAPALRLSIQEAVVALTVRLELVVLGALHVGLVVEASDPGHRTADQARSEHTVVPGRSLDPSSALLSLRPASKVDLGLDVGHGLVLAHEGTQLRNRSPGTDHRSEVVSPVAWDSRKDRYDGHSDKEQGYSLPLGILDRTLYLSLNVLNCAEVDGYDGVVVLLVQKDTLDLSVDGANQV